jgi:hypothetical protein
MIQIFLTMIILFPKQVLVSGMGKHHLLLVCQILKVDFDEPIIVPAGIKEFWYR